MTKEQAEVLYWMSQTLSENSGVWGLFLQKMGSYTYLKPEEIRDAINEAAAASGYAGEVETDDCKQ